MTLHFIRHGLTEANEKRLYCGHTDVPLSKKGRQEIVMLKEKVAYPSASVYVSSGLKRATETLQLLYNREPDVIIDEFMELNQGDFEMKSHDDLKDIPEYQRWINDIDNIACPNGESKPVFNNRVKAGFEKLLKLKTDSAVILCHGGVIVSILEQFFPGQKSFYEWQPENGRGYTLEANNGIADLISAI